MRSFVWMTLVIVAISLVECRPKKSNKEAHTDKKKQKEKYEMKKRHQGLEDFEAKGRKIKTKLRGRGDENDDFWRVQQAKFENDLPKELKEKWSKNNKHLDEVDADKFENEFGRYKNRSEIKAFDLVTIINRASDINTDGGDILMEDDPFPIQIEQNHHHDHQQEEKISQETKNFNKKLKGKRRKANFKNTLKREITKRDALRDRMFLWHSRVVPYVIENTFDGSAQNLIRSAMDQIESVTCIKFKVWSGEKNYINIVHRSGCWSSVGRRFWMSGSQDLSLGPGCVYEGTVMHELMHALGFEHEQSRTDRNNYVEVFWENIPTDKVHNFEKFSQNHFDFLGIPYDTSSLMHYGKYSFAKDASKPTILPLDKSVTSLGQRDHLSPSDIDQINILYDCKNGDLGWSNWSGYTPCATDCSRKRTRFCMHPSGVCENPVSTVMYGVDTQHSTCPFDLCYAPVDGHWGKWGTWGDCSTTCDEGVQSRTRECSDPASKYGGAECPGVTTSTRSCYLKSCDEGPYDCTFELDLCTWSTNVNEAISWTRHSGSTPTSSTGPDPDYSGGYYIYMEASFKNPGDKAVLLSSHVTSGTYCLNFDYHMYGLAIGELLVQVKDLTTQVTGIPLLHKSGDQFNMWHNAEATFVCENTCQVIFTAIRNGFQGDVALDEIVILNHACGALPTTTTTTTPVTNPPTTTTLPPTTNTTTTLPPTTTTTTTNPLPKAEPVVTRMDCYKDTGYLDGKRPFPEHINLRALIDWNEAVQTLSDIAALCSFEAKSRGFKYFAVEFWGECWFGADDQVNYSRDGESSGCWPKPENNLGPYLVGDDYSMMVYKWHAEG